LDEDEGRIRLEEIGVVKSELISSGSELVTGLGAAGVVVGQKFRVGLEWSQLVTFTLEQAAV
jgi:hypothetical protein